MKPPTAALRALPHPSDRTEVSTGILGDAMLNMVSESPVATGPGTPKWITTRAKRNNFGVESLRAGVYLLQLLQLP